VGYTVEYLSESDLNLDSMSGEHHENVEVEEEDVGLVMKGQPNLLQIWTLRWRSVSSWLFLVMDWVFT
jgi:hypothetical protein